MEGLTRDKINALAQIAAIDGEVAEEEKEVIYKIAEEHGYSRENVNYIFENPEPIGDFSDLTEDERLEFMFISLDVMQADDLIYNSEVEFCKTLATKLKIDPSVVDVYGTRADIDLENFMEVARRYLK